MPDHLTFRLYAPLASFGEIAVGERRGSWARPGKSAVLGLIAAALGLKRDDPAQTALAAGYDMAVRTAAAGRPLADYHTAQVPPARKGRRFATRREELLSDDLSTILSRRDYRTDAAFIVALRPRAEAPYALADLAEALRRPKFTLYLGRKSCPLGLPLAPQVITAENVIAAFAAYDAASGRMDVERMFGRSAPSGEEIAADIAFDDDLKGSELRIERRRDAPLDRKRWRFGLREEIVAQSPGEGEGG